MELGVIFYHKHIPFVFTEQQRLNKDGMIE